jgi:hypothetical protein
MELTYKVFDIWNDDFTRYTGHFDDLDEALAFVQRHAIPAGYAGKTIITVEGWQGDSANTMYSEVLERPTFTDGVWTGGPV